MEKFLTFLKRTCSLIGVLVLLFCCSAPAFAADTGTSSNDIRYSVLPFERLLLWNDSSGAEAILPWSANAFFSDGSVAASRVEVGDYSYSGSGTYSNGVASVSFSNSWTMSVTDMALELDRLVISNSYLRSASYAFTLGGGSTGNIQISFTLNAVELDGDQWKIHGVPVITSASGTSFDVTGMIYRAIQTSGYGAHNFHFLTDLRVEITNVTGTPTFSVSTSTQPDSSIPELSYWFNEWGVSSVIYQPADPGDLNFDWLISSVSGFLEAELWPGFTIGGALRIIFIIGLIFWFLKLTF